MKYGLEKYHTCIEKGGNLFLLLQVPSKHWISIKTQQRQKHLSCSHFYFSVKLQLKIAELVTRNDQDRKINVQLKAVHFIPERRQYAETHILLLKLHFHSSPKMPQRQYSSTAIIHENSYS